MVITETLMIDGTEFTRNYSDAGRYVVRDGVSYEEAYDPAEYGRTYTEGDFIPKEEQESYDGDEAKELLDILLGGIV